MGCRSSGLLTNGTHIVASGNCKLVSIHARNISLGGAQTLNVYDNTAGSGKVVARMTLMPDTSLEYDMHGVICSEGITLVIPADMDCTIEFA